MSYQGQTWVDEVALPQLQNTGELMVMLRVANHAGNGPRAMSGCFASSDKLAAACLMKARAVQGHLRELASRGLLVPGDPKLVAHIRADRRPPVYDLAGAHNPGCPGGHDIDGECLPPATGGKNDHPSNRSATTGSRKNHPSGNRRSASSKNDHPSDDEAATGSKIRHSRVAKFATESNKDFKDLSLSAEAGGEQQASAAPEATAEREEAPQNGTDRTPVDAVVEAYVMAHIASVGMPPRPHKVKNLREDAVGLLGAGRTVQYLEGLAADLARRGWADLVQHCAKNPEPERAAAAAAAAEPWCGQCPPPGHPDHRWIIPDDEDQAAKKCACFSGRALANA